jgi:type I protein arginine methyltransferase
LLEGRRNHGPVSDKGWIAESKGEKFWNNVYGFDFSPMVPGGALTDREIGVFDVPEKAFGGEPSTFYQLDLKHIQIHELDFSVPFSTKLSAGAKPIDAFAIWFDTFFLPPGQSQDTIAIDVANWDRNGEPGLGFSTGPYSTPTHWHQAVLLLDEEDRKKEFQGSTLKGTVMYKKTRRDVRGVDVTVSWEVDGLQGPVSGSVKRTMA